MLQDGMGFEILPKIIVSQQIFHIVLHASHRMSLILYVGKISSRKQCSSKTQICMKLEQQVSCCSGPHVSLCQGARYSSVRVSWVVLQQR